MGGKCYEGIVIVFLIFHSIAPICAQIQSDWHGYKMMDFNFEQHAAKIVFPKESNQGKHWIWRARFWGHEPQTDIALLELGFHVVYVDVADMFGAPPAVEIWNGFYQYLVDSMQLHRKAVLEGFSRGGLIVYNWAAENVDKVACIYADAPVCDINSWPGGKGLGRGSETDWQKCLQAYDLDGDQAQIFRGIPIYSAIKVAEAKIPVIHVCGNADGIVPIEENSYLIEKIFQDQKSKFKLIEKEGVGHHPHSLKDPLPIVKFILENTDSSLIPQRMYQETKRTVYFRTHCNNSRQIFLNKQRGTVAFLGGSITHNPGWRDSVMVYLQKKFPTTIFSFINAGIPSMGSTPGAFRLHQDVLSRGKIDLLFVEAAVNDATNGRSAIAQIRGMEGIVRHALESNPMMDILMMHFVDPDKMAAYNRGAVPEVILQHEKVANYYKITSINLAKEVNDRILHGEFSWKDDFKDLHPSPFGQRVYANTIEWTLEALWKLEIGQDVKPHLLPRVPFDVYSYYRGHYVDIKKAKKKKGWTIEKHWKPDDGVSTRDGFVHVPALVTTQSGSSLAFDFKGKAIGILVAAGPDVGILEYSIDGSFYKTVDLFTPWSKQLHLPWLYVLEDELREGPHHLILRSSKFNNPESKGYACRIFKFAIN
ncbi:MAG: prolyl oligopeptidase family serine peptidase [Saprospiraceae bacterium]|nr:prolyl oligopeptidase family serine peptidase [Saprospiraceae bacterium]